MYLPDFDYYAPATLKDACFTLARLDGGASVLAGGTDLLPYMKNEVMAPTAIVSLKEIQGLQGITYVPDSGGGHRGQSNSKRPCAFAGAAG